MTESESRLLFRSYNRFQAIMTISPENERNWTLASSSDREEPRNGIFRLKLESDFRVYLAIVDYTVILSRNAYLAESLVNWRYSWLVLVDDSKRRTPIYRWI